MRDKTKHGVTLVELLVVLLIISLLATITTTVYTGTMQRAQIAVARTEIRELELNATRYEVDLGEFPVSSSGTTLIPPTVPQQGPRYHCTNGCAYLILCLQHSLSGDATKPASPKWNGPYMNIQLERLGDDTTNGRATRSTPVWERWLLDPWGNPYFYVRHNDYATVGGAEQNQAAGGETFYNPTTVQIFSLGPDGITVQGGTATNDPFVGLGADDINNYDNTTRF